MSGFLEGLEIEDRVSTNCFLEILRVEGFDHVASDNFKESLFEGTELLLDVGVEKEISIEFNVLRKVLFCDWNGRTFRFEVVVQELTKGFRDNLESEFKL